MAIKIAIEMEYPDVVQMRAGVYNDVTSMANDMLAADYVLSEPGKKISEELPSYSYIVRRGSWWGHCYSCKTDIWREEERQSSDGCPECGADGDELIPF